MKSADTRFRELSDTYLGTLLNSITLDQMRSVLFKLLGMDAPSVSTKTKAIEAISSLGRTTETVSIILELEACSPNKHCLLMKLADDQDPENLWRGRKKFESTNKEFLSFKEAYTRKDDKAMLIMLEHSVDVADWRTINEDEKIRQLIDFKVRHFVVIRYEWETRLLAFFFPGYSQGSGIKKERRLSYQELIEELVRIIQEKIEVELASFPVEKAIKLLSEADSRRLKIVKSDFESNRGKMSLSAPTKEKESVDEYLTNFISPYVKDESKDKLHGAIREALRNTSPRSLAVMWLEEEVVTRLNFWDLGTEFLFIWYGQSKNLAPIYRIIDLINSVSDQISTPTHAEILEKISSLSPSDVITVGELNASYGVNPTELKSLLAKAVSAGLVAPVYRLKSEELVHGYHNDWTTRLSVLNRSFTTESDAIIQGGDPKNIEVAFMKISGVRN